MVKISDMETDEHLELWLWGGHGYVMVTAVLVKDGEEGRGRPVDRLMIPANGGTATLNLGKRIPKSRRRRARVQNESVILLEDVRKFGASKR